MKSFYMAKGSKILHNNQSLKIEDLLRQNNIDLNACKTMTNITRIRSSFGEELFVSSDAIVETNNGNKLVTELTVDDFIKCDWQLAPQTVIKGSTIDWIQGYLLESTSFFDDKTIKFRVKGKSTKEKLMTFVKKEFQISTLKEETLPKNVFQITIESSNLKKKDLFLQTRIMLQKYHTEKRLPSIPNHLLISGYLESLEFNGKHLDFEDGKIAYDLFYKLQLLRIYSSFYRSDDGKKFRVNIFDLKDKLIFFTTQFNANPLLDDLKVRHANTEEIWGKIHSINFDFKNMESYQYPFNDTEILLGGCYLLNNKGE